MLKICPDGHGFVALRDQLLGGVNTSRPFLVGLLPEELRMTPTTPVIDEPSFGTARTSAGSFAILANR